jgi:hypothetical protein
MPKLFLHQIHKGECILDEDGADFINLDALRRELILAARGSAILVDAMGLSSFELCDVLINQLANATSKGQEVQEVILHGALAVVKGIQPRDDLEALLAAQMAVTHNLAMDLGRRLRTSIHSRSKTQR